MSRPPPLLLAFLALILPACAGDDEDSFRFRRLEPEHTGVRFANTITTSEAHDFLADAFIYNGAGVGVGDVDGDGRPDIYLAGNMVSSRLYLNRGGMRFEDVTEAAGVSTDRWATGVSMVDIEGDGDLDIYVSVAGPEWTELARRENLLFLNDGDGTFTECARRFGIADQGFTTHAVFLDYDRDGHLDLFLLGNSPGEFGRGETGQMDFGGGGANPAGFDQLYRNRGDGTFENVSEAAGIVRKLGYGLGVAAADLNRDGWPDLYVSNDIAPNDVLYVNNGDGTFTDRAAEWLDHTSFAGMGLDIADYTNDGWPDILQTDMMPADLAARKRVSGGSTQAALEGLRLRGFYPQFNINTLQLGRGVDENGRAVFSEIGRMAGVAYTDWSWAALFADFDNDGLKDAFVTNGYPKAVTDFDYQANVRMVRRMADQRTGQRLMREMLDTLPGYRVPNHVFRNNGDLTFVDRSQAWRVDDAGYSYGAAYADLDGDGLLDLVINNIDAEAWIYRGSTSAPETARHLTITLQGDPPNRHGLGARVRVTAAGERQYLEQSPYRGYMSTVDTRLHLGLGDAERVDSVEVVWPDGRVQAVEDVATNADLTLRQSAARWPEAPGLSTTGADRRRYFHRVESTRGLHYDHVESTHRYDYSLQPLLPEEISRLGPPLAAADVDGDGLDDLYIGGGGGTPARLLLQNSDGDFTPAADQPWIGDESGAVAWGAVFFDANGDSLPDLYIAHGGNHLPAGSSLLQDRLYLNQGAGRFRAAEGAVPEMATSTAAVCAADFDGDGDLDLFVGGRLTPGEYPAPPRSYLLRNEGGRFVDATPAVAPHLIDPGGMLTDAVWTDANGDGRPDLVTAGIWLPVQLHLNEEGGLRPVTGRAGIPSFRGWWHSLAAGDLDGDGDVDLVAGNLGLNHTYTTSRDSPFGVYAGDLDGDRSSDLVFTREVDGQEYPFYGLALLGRFMEPLSIRYLTHEGFADQSMTEIFGEERLDAALHYQADTFASVWLENRGAEGFTARALPLTAQISPLYAVLVHDVDEDGALDLVVAGNNRGTEPNTPAADAGKGLWLRGDGRGGFLPVSPTASGLLTPHDARDLQLLRTPSGSLLVVANNDGPLQAFSIGRSR